MRWALDVVWSFWTHFQEACHQDTVDGSEIRLTSWYGKYLIIYRVEHTSQVVVWDFWTINSIVLRCSYFVVNVLPKRLWQETIQLVAVPTLYHGVRRHSRWGYNSRGVQVRALNVFGWLLILFVSRTFGFKRTVSESFFGHETCNFNMYFTYMYNQYINIYSNHVQVHIWSISHLQTPRIWSPAVWRWWKWPTWILQTFQSWIV